MLNEKFSTDTYDRNWNLNLPWDDNTNANLNLYPNHIDALRHITSEMAAL